MGFFGDFGMITTESAIQEALKAFTVLNQILGFDLKGEKSAWGIRIEFLGAAVAFLMIRNKCEAQLSASRERIQKISEEIEAILAKKGHFFGPDSEVSWEIELRANGSNGESRRSGPTPAVRHGGERRGGIG